jgi:ankyrin repeat protein
MHLQTLCPDILIHVASMCDTIRNISNMSLLCKAFNTTLMHSKSGRKMWAETASRITGFRPLDITGDDFHKRIKLILCPWLSIPQTLQLPVNTLMDPDNMRITLADKDTISLWLNTDDQFKAIGVSQARPEKTNWVFQQALSDIQTPRDQHRSIFQQIRTPRQLKMLTNQDECFYFYQKIHESALAIIEMTPWDMDQRNGIYFFRKTGGRATKFLRHILIGKSLAQTNMIIKPMEMWMLTEENVIYFGPSGDPQPLTRRGRMDKSLWLAGAGKIKAAISHMQALGIADINTPSITGNMTLLHVATLQNNSTSVRMLLRAKADPEAEDDQEMSCVMIAASMEFPVMIRILCTVANPNKQNLFNETALHMVGNDAIPHYNRTIKTVTALLDCFADPNIQDIKGNTPLFSYGIITEPSAVYLLCSRGANPVHRNYEGMTPIHTAYNNRETLEMLVLKFNADVNAQTNEGKTALMLAAHERIYMIVLCLLNDLGANPRLKDNQGHTALWYAENGVESPSQAYAVMRMLESRIH